MKCSSVSEKGRISPSLLDTERGFFFCVSRFSGEPGNTAHKAEAGRFRKAVQSYEKECLPMRSCTTIAVN